MENESSQTQPQAQPQQESPEAQQSVLGVDPEPAAEQAPPPATEAAEQQTQEPRQQVREVPEEDYQRLLQGSRAFEMIENDPAIASTVQDYFRHKRSDTPMQTQEPTQQPQNQQPDPVQSELQSLREEYQNNIQSMGRVIANMQVQQFRQQNPDMDNYRQQMHEYITKHNMPLDRAYELAKLEAAKTSTPPATRGAHPAAPTTEGRGAGSASSLEGDVLQSARAMIDDPKKPKMGIDEAFDIALKAAQQHHAG